MSVPIVLEHVDGEAVAPELPPLLAAVYAEVQREPAALPALHSALRRLLLYLASPPGRTNANCWAADLFFMHNDRWERDWEHLPEGYQDLLGYLGSALHDTVSHPDVAANFANTPEQLLARLDRLAAGARPV